MTNIYGNSDYWKWWRLASVFSRAHYVRVALHYTDPEEKWSLNRLGYGNLHSYMIQNKPELPSQHHCALKHSAQLIHCVKLWRQGQWNRALKQWLTDWRECSVFILYPLFNSHKHKMTLKASKEGSNSFCVFMLQQLALVQGRWSTVHCVGTQLYKHHVECYFAKRASGKKTCKGKGVMVGHGCPY